MQVACQDTLGCLLAAYITSNSTGRVLLLSTTNVAVDQAILAVDDGLTQLKRPGSHGGCLRFGSRFEPKSYPKQREHLIPVRNKGLIHALRTHLSSAPDPVDASAYHAWKEELEEIRSQISRENREFLGCARVSAMTATYAVFKYEELRSCPPYDVVVFDEASQVGKAHAMMLARLGRRVLFAGDPKQLSPIVQSDDEKARTWLGSSPFEWMGLCGTKTCMLDEQWRMAPDICKVVSNLFYDGKLSVATPALKDSHWLADRVAHVVPAIGSGHVSVVEVQREAEYIPRIGYVCKESAELVAQIAAGLRTLTAESDIQILTPYRAQRAEIRKRLIKIGMPPSLVSTVHRAQGTERRVVILDPVRPSAAFVSNAEGKRLLNVAMSRAQAQLIVLLAPDYVKNRVMVQLVEMFPLKRAAPRTVKDVPRLKPVSGGEVPAVVSAVKLRTALPPNAPPIEQFRAELYRELLLRPAILYDRKQFARELAATAPYYRLGWSALKRVIHEVLDELPQPASGKKPAPSKRQRRPS